MKILIVTNQDTFFLSHVLNRAIYIKSRGNIVAVAAKKTSDNAANRIISLGFQFYDIKIKRGSVNLVSQILTIVDLYKVNKMFRPDVSYHLGAKAIFYGTFAARVYNPEVGILNAPIGLGYIFSSQSLKAFILRPIVLFLYKLFLNPNTSRVIVENTDDIRFFVRKGYLKVSEAFCIFGAGVDTRILKPNPNIKKNAVCTVVMACRLLKDKGVLEFVKAADLLYENKIQVKMQIIGEPDYENPSSISSWDYSELKNNPAVECLGFRKSIEPYLQRAHICCLPSYREGLPKFLIEGCSLGLAILTTDTVGCREIIRNKNGFLVKKRDAFALYEFIKYMVDHKNEVVEMGARSRDVAVKYFDSELINKRTYEVLETLK